MFVVSQHVVHLQPPPYHHENAESIWQLCEKKVHGHHKSAQALHVQALL
jgi:hypothetical protein